MTIPTKVRPHTEQAVREIERAETEGEVWYAVLALSAKLKFYDDGRNIDELTREETDKLIFHWLDGYDDDEFETYFELSIDYIIEFMEEEER